MKTTIQLDDKLFEKAKQYALNKGTTFTAIIEEALCEKLIKRPVVTKVSQIKLKTVNGLGVNAGVALDDSASLSDIM